MGLVDLLILSWFVTTTTADGVERAHLSRDTERGDVSWSERQVFPRASFLPTDALAGGKISES